MGIKIEHLLFIAIVLIIGGSLTMKLNDTGHEKNRLIKELEFTNTTFTEVNTSTLQSRAYGTYGIKEEGVLTIENLRYETETIKSLVANKGVYMGNIIYLEGDIELHDNNGYTYQTQQAEYNQNTEILNLTAPFVAFRDKNIIKGDTLTYDTKHKVAFGTVIDAVIYTIDK